jgi:NAD(P)-dependent dehydrogenase (short-subunit alcohol dehydrogenase family)
VTVLLQDRVVIVAGIAPGLGRAIALNCARHGADVVLAARTEGRLEAIAAEVTALGRKAVPVAADLATDDGCRQVLDRTLDAFDGRVDVLVNNAFQQPPFELLAEQSIETVEQSFQVNLSPRCACPSR